MKLSVGKEQRSGVEPYAFKSQLFHLLCDLEKIT